MDLTYLIQNRDTLEVAGKQGLYCISQSHIPPKYAAYRCGLAGKNVEDPAFKSSQGTFATRAAIYLNSGFLPTDGKIWAALTVPRRRINNFSERVVDPDSTKEGFRRMDDATTLIQIRERQYHAMLVRFGMDRLGMPGTPLEQRRGEFFRGPLQVALKALKGIGQGDLYIFNGNKEPTKQTLTRGDKIDTEQIPMRESPRLVVQKDVVDLLQNDDPGTKRALERLSKLHVKPKTATTPPIVFTAKKTDLAKVGVDKRVTRAMAKIGDVRRSPRFA